MKLSLIIALEFFLSEPDNYEYEEVYTDAFVKDIFVA